jgi:hypothetical protein
MAALISAMAAALVSGCVPSERQGTHADWMASCVCGGVQVEHRAQVNRRFGKGIKVSCKKSICRHDERERETYAPLRSTKHFNTLAAKPIIDPSDWSSTSTRCMAVDDETTSAAKAPLEAANNAACHEAVNMHKAQNFKFDQGFAR